MKGIDADLLPSPRNPQLVHILLCLGLWLIVNQAKVALHARYFREKGGMVGLVDENRGKSALHVLRDIACAESRRFLW